MQLQTSVLSMHSSYLAFYMLISAFRGALRVACVVAVQPDELLDAERIETVSGMTLVFSLTASGTGVMAMAENDPAGAGGVLGPAAIEMGQVWAARQLAVLQGVLLRASRDDTWCPSCLQA